MQSDEELKVFNAAVANRVVRWWEVQSSESGFDRDTLYLEVRNIPDRIIDVPGAGGLPDMRPEPQYIRISAEHREFGAALRLEVVESIPDRAVRNISLPVSPGGPLDVFRTEPKKKHGHRYNLTGRCVIEGCDSLLALR